MIMDELNKTLEAMEIACEGEAELRSFTAPQLAAAIATVKALPEDQRAAVRERLDRISTILDGQMMLYKEEIDKLGGKIRDVAKNNAGTQAYRTVAVIPVDPEAPKA